MREALIEHIIMKYSIPDCIIMDQDSAFMSSLMNYLFRKFEIKFKTGSSIQSSVIAGRALHQISIKYLMEKGQMWHKYLPLATFVYNTFNSPNLVNHSPILTSVWEKTKIAT